MTRLTRFDASPLEMILFMLFVAYISFKPVSPPILSSFIDTPIGTAVVIMLTVYIFLFTHPILGILSLFVAYELIRRNNKMTLSMIQYTTTKQPKIDPVIQEIVPGPEPEETLEETIIHDMAPIPIDMSLSSETLIEPVFEHVHNASIY